jgi:ketosteroid isomerase-like protein
MSEQSVLLVKRMNAAFNEGDYETTVELVAPEAEIVDHTPLPDGAPATQGPGEMRDSLERWRAGFAGLHCDVSEYVDRGDFVVAVSRWRFVSRETGIATEWPGAEAYEIRDGRVVWGAVGLRDREAAIAAAERRAAGASRR